MARQPDEFRDETDDLDAGEMLEAMDLTQHYREDLLKELATSYEKVLERASEAIQAQGTLYHWWWQFMQAHRQYPSVERDPRRDDGIANTERLFGDLSLDFREWWTRTGHDRFQEQGGLPLIRVIDIDRDFDRGEFPKSITLEIPLTIPRDGIVHQLDKLLAICHPGSALQRHETSTATLKINPKPRYHLNKMDGLLKLWTKINSEPEWLDRSDHDWWEIARFMGDNKMEGQKLKYDDYEGLPHDIKRELGKNTRRLYERANRIMTNAVRGKFPLD